MSNNQPDITAPVSGNRGRFIGVTGNLNGGTVAAGADPNGFVNNLGNGSANNNIGGNVYRGAGQSSNQFPVSQASVEFVGGGGSAPQPQTNSNNPPSIQADTTDRVYTEVVAQTTPALVSTPASGPLVNFPKSNKTSDFGSSSSVSSNIVLRTEKPTALSAGITVPQALSSNDPGFLNQERIDVVDTNVVIQGRIDGKSNVNLAAVYPSGVQMYNPANRLLPNKVVNSTEIGETNVSGNI